MVWKLRVLTAVDCFRHFTVKVGIVFQIWTEVISKKLSDGATPNLNHLQSLSYTMPSLRQEAGKTSVVEGAVGELTAAHFTECTHLDYSEMHASISLFLQYILN